MIKFLYLICIALGVGGLAGCASPQIHYHSLVSARSPLGLSAPAGDPASARYALEVLPVGLPALVDRQELVVRQNEQLLVLDDERWAGTLGDEVHDTLSALLRQRLGVPDVSGLAASAGTPVLRVKMMVRDFQSAPGYYALLDADWSLTRSDKPLQAHPVCHSRFSVSPEKPGYAALAQAHQQVLGAVTEQIAQTAGAWMETGSVVCAHAQD